MIANLEVSEAWILQDEALFNVGVADTDVDFYASCSVSAVEEKKCKYLSAPELCALPLLPFLLYQLMGKTLANGFVAPCRMVKILTRYGRKQIS